VTTTQIYERGSNYFASFSQIHSGQKTTVTFGGKLLSLASLKELNCFEIKKVVEIVEVQR